MYSELDQLSAAWEALDRQVKSKVFELKDMEDRVVKCGLDVRIWSFESWRHPNIRLTESEIR